MASPFPKAIVIVIVIRISVVNLAVMGVPQQGKKSPENCTWFSLSNSMQHQNPCEFVLVLTPELVLSALEKKICFFVPSNRQQKPQISCLEIPDKKRAFFCN